MTCDKPQPASESDIFRNITSSTHTQTRAHTPLRTARGMKREEMILCRWCCVMLHSVFLFDLVWRRSERLYNREKDTSVSFHGSSGLSEELNAHTCDRRSPANTCYEKPAEPSAHSMNPTGSHTHTVHTLYTNTVSPLNQRSSRLVWPQSGMK